MRKFNIKWLMVSVFLMLPWGAFSETLGTTYQFIGLLIQFVGFILAFYIFRKYKKELKSERKQND